MQMEMFSNHFVTTCDLQALVVSQFLSEESGHDQLWAQNELDLFLDQSFSQHPSTYKLAGKIHLSNMMKERSFKGGTEFFHGLTSDQILQDV